jgi:hypothetical protein
MMPPETLLFKRSGLLGKLQVKHFHDCFVEQRHALAIIYTTPLGFLYDMGYDALASVEVLQARRTVKRINLTPNASFHSMFRKLMDGQLLLGREGAVAGTTGMQPRVHWRTISLL